MHEGTESRGPPGREAKGLRGREGQGRPLCGLWTETMPAGAGGAEYVLEGGVQHLPQVHHHHALPHQGCLLPGSATKESAKWGCRHLPGLRLDLREYCERVAPRDAGAWRGHEEHVPARDAGAWRGQGSVMISIISLAGAGLRQAQQGDRGAILQG